MNGLRNYTRDGQLPAQYGDEDLNLLGEAEVLELVHEHLAEPGAKFGSAELVHARWKPRVSSAAAYVLSRQDGLSVTLTVKRYATAKATDIAASYRPSRYAQEALAEVGLKPFCADPDARLCAFTYPADRMLPGLPKALDRFRATRLLEGLLGLDDLALRRHRTTLVLLRYKPERRAVLLLKTIQREGRVDRRFLLRVHPPAVARAAAHSRALCPDLAIQGIGPRFLGCEERTGTLLEEYLPGRAPAPDCFEHAEQMGRLLARLHTLPTPAQGTRGADGDAPNGDGAAKWFEFDSRLRDAALGLDERPAAEQTAWIHGDLHPDQVLIDDRGEMRLVDLDGLTRGDPQMDLASWIGDHLAEDTSATFEAAATPLLAGYTAAGGRSGDRAVLVERVANELTQRAAACLRRLELGAPRRAHELLERARDLRAGSGAA